MVNCVRRVSAVVVAAVAVGFGDALDGRGDGDGDRDADGDGDGGKLASENEGVGVAEVTAVIVVVGDVIVRGGAGSGGVLAPANTAVIHSPLSPTATVSTLADGSGMDSAQTSSGAGNTNSQASV